MKDPTNQNPTPDDDGIDRRGFLECMTWAGTGVLWMLSGGLPRSVGLASAEAARRPGEQRTHVPADQRQPRRLRQAGEPGRACDAAGGGGQDQGHARQAVLHDPHRRHQPSLEGEGVRRRRADHQGSRRTRVLCAGRARSHRRGERQGLPGALRRGHARRRLLQLRPGRRSTSSAS